MVIFGKATAQQNPPRSPLEKGEDDLFAFEISQLMPPFRKEGWGDFWAPPFGVGSQNKAPGHSGGCFAVHRETQGVLGGHPCDYAFFVRLSCKIGVGRKGENKRERRERV